MNGMGLAPTEQAVIAEARRQGVDEITVQFGGLLMPMCGVCGRIVCHPDCSRYGVHGTAFIRETP